MTESRFENEDAGSRANATEIRLHASSFLTRSFLPVPPLSRMCARFSSFLYFFYFFFFFSPFCFPVVCSKDVAFVRSRNVFG